MTGPGVDVEAVKAELVGVRFLDLVTELGGSLKGARRSARDVRIPCFMHGGSGPNLVLTPTGSDGALWHCLTGCGVGGDVFALVERARGLPFGEAVRWLGVWTSQRDPQPRMHAWHVRRGLEDIPSPTRSPDPIASPSVPEDGAANAFLTALWSRVVDAPWSGPVARWLAEVRGVEPDAAFALGCRDFGTVRGALAEIVDETPVEVLQAVGLARDGRLHPALDGCLRGDLAWSAVAVPAWPLGADSPARWRFRLLAPRAVRGGASVKVFGPYGGGADLLGVGRPARLDHPEVAMAWLGSGTDGGGLVVLVEGEPDWWSTTEVVEGRAVVLGVCGAPARWREGWPDLDELAALGVRRVAVCVHRGKPGVDGLGHGERFARAVEGASVRAGVGFTRKLAAEGRDLNDLHRAGALRDWLADVLEVTHGV